MSAANAAIDYHPDGFRTDRKRLMGRHAAGEGFLAGFVRHAAVERFYCFAPDTAAFTHFREQIGKAGARTPAAAIPQSTPERLAEVGCLFRGDPGIAEYAWRRRFADQRGYSLCGVTHTIASAYALDAMAAWLSAPVQSWDAVICTSAVVKHTVESVLGSWQDYFEARLGARPPVALQLPVIPLGVDCDRFAPDAAARARLRAQLEAGEETVVVLFFGRLSFHAKAHPAAMYMALERAARETGKDIVLVQAGWFANDAIEDAFIAGARAFCPHVRTVFWDGRDPAIRGQAWQAADILASLSDNVQETFGLVPIEAMAAGLPVVVSDWNGYRDTVRHGVDGFMVPTAMPAAGLGDDLAWRHFTGRDHYDRYIGTVSQTTAVDIAAATEAFAALINDPGRRRTMGAAGRAHVRANFDWRHIIARYQALWSALAERRRADGEIAPPAAHGRPAHPHFRDPYGLFASYPTRAITETTRIALAPGADARRLARLREHSFFNFAADQLSDSATCEAVLQHLADGEACSVESLLAAFAPAERHRLHRSLGWLAKLDLIRFVDDPDGPVD